MSRPLVRCSYYTANFLCDYSDPDVDVATLDYVTATESLWMSHLRELRSGSKLPRDTGWAELRYSWYALTP